MDKTPSKLIDADKLMGWINTELAKEYPESVNQYVDGRETLLKILKVRLEQGKFNPEPIPPTIKPGDKAIHSDLGQVKIISEPMVSVLKDKTEYEVYLSDLEVSHD
ncbi:hypothetical protein D3C74_151480 [compost metagenome]